MNRTLVIIDGGNFYRKLKGLGFVRTSEFKYRQFIDWLVGNEYDKVILVSSDTDLIPAIKESKNLGKIIEYIGFENSPSFALIRFSNSRRLLRKEDLQLFNNSTQ
jgi:hypothetical protein